jgi:deoxycytidylate deaminase
MRINGILASMAMNSDHHRSKHSAVIVYKNDIISLACNRTKSHPFQKRYSKANEAIFLHAEVAAIHNALKRISLKELSKATMYVCRVRINNDNKHYFSYSKPCDGCMRAIAEFDIKTVFYTDDEGKFINL